MDARKEQACLNTDKELWREEDSYYSPRVFATAQNGIGIEVGGHCFVKPVRDWHKLGRVVDELAVFAFLDERFHGDAGVGLRTFLRERFGIDGSASPDAQGSVTEQSQQNLRQVPDALLERLCGMVYATRGEQYDHGYINDLEYAALVRLRHSGHGSIETVLTALTAQPHHKEREEQGMTEQSQQKSRQDGEA